MTLIGKCACGSVNYKIKDKPLFTQACHCNNCKISTGSSFVIHTMIFEDDFELNGNVESTLLPTGSGKGYRAYFCNNCGIYTHHNPRSNPSLTGFNLGCLDEIDTFELNDIQINDGKNHPLDKK